MWQKNVAQWMSMVGVDLIFLQKQYNIHSFIHSFIHSTLSNTPFIHSTLSDGRWENAHTVIYGGEEMKIVGGKMTAEHAAMEDGEKLIMCDYCPRVMHLKQCARLIANYTGRIGSRRQLAECAWLVSLECSGGL